MSIYRIAAWIVIGGLIACGIGLGVIFGVLMAASHVGVGF